MASTLKILPSQPGLPLATTTRDGAQSKEDKAKLDTIAPGGWFDERWLEMQEIDATIDKPLPLLGHSLILAVPTPPTHIAWDATVNMGAVKTDASTSWGYMGPHVLTAAVAAWAVSMRVKSPAHDASGGKYCGFGMVDDAGTNKVIVVASFDTQAMTKFTFNYNDGSQKFAATSVNLDTEWHDFTIGWSPTTGYITFLIDGAQALSTAGAGKFANVSMRAALISNVVDLQVQKVLLGGVGA